MKCQGRHTGRCSKPPIMPATPDHQSIYPSICPYCPCPALLISALHRMPRGLAMRKVSVRLSVPPSVKRMDCDKTEEKSVPIFIPYERSFSCSFLIRRMVGGATPFTWNFASTDPRWSEIADFQPIFARSVSTITLSEISSIRLTLIGSPLHALQWAW